MKATQINKPNIKAAEALAFASESTETIEQAKPAKTKKTKPQTTQRASSQKRIFHAPEGDKRLTINIKQELHKKLKIAAINNEMTAGELIESLIEKHL
jgi:hypothetical protein